MKRRKFLMLISYLLIPVIVAMMGLSVLSKYVENDENFSMNQSQYFRTDNFVANYMHTLGSYANQLIYHNEEFPMAYDGEIQISYVDQEEFYYSNKIQNQYVLICYQNKALTNVELTTETNTIEKIKNYIATQENAKIVNILAGNTESNSDVISNKGLKYYDTFEYTYYTVSGKENVYHVYDEEDVFEESATNVSPAHQYVSTTIQDFTIYSSYQEALVYRTDLVTVREWMKKFEPLGNKIHLILPIGIVVLLLIGFYLILVIGRTKAEDEACLNDFDKIPYEILCFLAFFGFGVCILMLNIPKHTEEYINMAICAYCVAYIICAMLFHTTVKRIKAKMLIKSTLFYKCWMWFVKIVKKTICKLKNFWNQSTKSIELVKKLWLVVIGYVIVAVILLGIFQEFGFLLDLVLGLYLFHKIADRIRCFGKIESHLKEIYEGNNQVKLKPEDFTIEFQDTVKYINDISNGFENAIQEGIKSEHLKTELITNVSHDIKTPLTSIINYVDLLRKEEIQNDKANEYIDVLDNKSQRLKKLTEDLVEASKASSGNVKLNMEKINVAELIKQSIGEFEDKFNALNLAIITNIPEEEIYIQADSRYMYRIIENIFGNISKYALENSRVYIDIAKKGKKVQMDVKNISKEILNISADELMQRFVRGDKSRTTEGSGLGISISKSLVELQKGKLDLKIDGDLFKVELIFDILEN